MKNEEKVTAKTEMIEQVKELSVRIKEATAAIGNAAGEALVYGNKEPMKKALENYEREVEKIKNLEKQYERETILLVSLICYREVWEIFQITEKINPDKIREQCGIV